jgi:hypothetical protein
MQVINVLNGSLIATLYPSIATLYSTGMVHVDAFERKVFDFQSDDKIEASGLFACVAVLTCRRDLSSATLAHLTMADDMEEYIKWLKANSTHNDIMCITGGRSIPHPSSYELVASLTNALHDAGYQYQLFDVLGNKKRKIVLERTGVITISHRSDSGQYIAHITASVDALIKHKQKAKPNS